MLLPAISWPGGSLENTGIIVAVIVGTYLSALWLAAIIWTARDIRERARDPITQVVAVLIVVAFTLPGWVLYLVLRPPLTLAEVYERQLEEESLLQDLQNQLACPECGHDVSDDYVVCPRCAHPLKEPCGACDRPLLFSWHTCPWCATPKGRLASRALAPSSRAEERAENLVPATPRPVHPDADSAREIDPSPFRRRDLEGHAPAAASD